MEVKAIGLFSSIHTSICQRRHIYEDVKGIQAEKWQGLTLAHTQTHKNIYDLIQ